MSDIRERLVNCFSVVFPTLSRNEIPFAKDTSVANWDSLATVTLGAVIEEEFGVFIMPEEYEQMTSFEAVSELLQGKSADVSS